MRPRQGTGPFARLRRTRELDEQGVTMVEMLVVMLTLGILLAIALPIVTTLLRTTSRVDVTYANVDQQLWLSTNLQRLVRSAVAPDPSVSDRPPVPAFVPGTITPTSMTFYSDVGTPNGPEEVKASCTPTSSDQTLCAAPTSTFTVAVTPATKSSCPTTSSSAKTCTWSSAKTHLLVQITHVKDGANHKPLFVYAYGPQATPGQPMATTTVCALSGAPSGCSSTDATEFGTTTCKAETALTSLKPFATCPPGEIDSVSYDLQINANTSSLNGGNQAEDDTGIFLVSSTSMLFDPSVG
ncbi:MAG: type II secretion system protein [Acidimicrobiales bacterium]